MFKAAWYWDIEEYYFSKMCIMNKGGYDKKMKEYILVLRIAHEK